MDVPKFIPVCLWQLSNIHEDSSIAVPEQTILSKFFVGLLTVVVQAVLIVLLATRGQGKLNKQTIAWLNFDVNSRLALLFSVSNLGSQAKNSGFAFATLFTS